MANTDKKSADAKAVQQREQAAGQRKAEDQPRPSGDSPKRQGDPLRHLIDEEK